MQIKTTKIILFENGFFFFGFCRPIGEGGLAPICDLPLFSLTWGQVVIARVKQKSTREQNNGRN